MSVREGKIELRIGNQVYRGNYMEDLRISEGNINEVLKTQPERFAFWSQMEFLARMIAEKWKMELERTEAQVYLQFREEASLNGEKITEKTLEAKMRLSPEIDSVRQRYLQAKLQYERLRAVAEAFRQRKDMIMSLAANLREEMDSSLSLREKKFVDERLRRAVSENNEHSS